MPITSSHFSDEIDGSPDGGQTYGRGFAIAWQRGPLTLPDGSRDEPNGAFVEDIIKAAKDRLEYYQGTKFKSPFNAHAIRCLEDALAVLSQRTMDRQSRGVEGMHQV